ncbi:receptor-type tyrosine-protein phosphatase F-like protein [Turdus rufiventris]|nr:receptor-type tyrosine-protein phosphatase F-like protein [Turdus rufiventris]
MRERCCLLSSAWSCPEPLLSLLGKEEKSIFLPGKPTFMKAPEDQIGISGGVASFVCQATGEPKPRITWMKKGKKVSSQRFEVIEFDDGSGSVLRIQPLRVHRDEAIYECTATNSVGEINTSAKLTVLEAEFDFPSNFGLAECVLTSVPLQVATFSSVTSFLLVFAQSV